MKQWFAKLSFGYPSMSTCILIEAETEEEAWNIAYEETVSWAETYGFYQDPEYFGTNDDVGSNWDDEEAEYEQTGEIGPSVKPYDPEKHDGHLS
jgi:hypothetical protein